MPLDPAQGFALDPQQSTADQLAELRRRVDSLERQPTVQETAGMPTTTGRNGTLGVDTTAPKLWLRREGTWVYCTTSG